MADKLDEKGFIFLDAEHRPYLCRIWGGEPWLFYWHEHQRSFVSLRPINQADIFSFPHNLSEEQQEIYRKQHSEFTNGIKREYA